MSRFGSFGVCLVCFVMVGFGMASFGRYGELRWVMVGSVKVRCGMAGMEKERRFKDGLFMENVYLSNFC